ncbi:MAG TPA: sigma 54-interacting transcriptional regulator, partial [Terriglobia bacterium]|nr:sigma 54-interacting transcriptional regulator [Terriglobia bacterium]
SAGMSHRQITADPTARRLSQYRALLEVTESISVNRDLPDLIRDLSTRLKKAVQFDFIGLMLHDPARNVLRVCVFETPLGAEKLEGVEMAVDECPAGQVLMTQEPLIVDDVDVATVYPAVLELLRAEGIRGYCSLPLTSPVRRLGALSFGSLQPRAYLAEDVEFLGQVARQVAVAVDNALHRQESQNYRRELIEERDRLQLLLRVNNALVSNLDLKSLFIAISKSLRDVLRHDYTSLALHDKERDLLTLFAIDFPTGTGLLHEDMAMPLEGSRAGKAFLARKPMLIRNFESGEFYSDVSRRFTEEGLRSGISLPLLTNRGPIATMTLASRRESAFTERDVELMIQIAAQVAIAVENAVSVTEIAALKDKLAEEKLYLEDEIRAEFNFEEIIGESGALKGILQQVETVAGTDSTVLILGETGTGKELIARAIHNLSARRARTFVKLNCSAIPTGLLESELFGHEKGAFTGAIAQRIGRFELAHRGTLFLDEVGDIPLELQPKLLRVLQEQEFERLGSPRTIRTDARLVAATNRDLAGMVADRQFRSELYYRLNVFPIVVPPLRARAEDIPLLVRYFAQKLSRRMNKRIESVPGEAIEAMKAYHWPGNIRELENFVERAVILSKGSVLQAPVYELRNRAGTIEPVEAESSTLEHAEREHILKVLAEHRWPALGSLGAAAASLGMKRTTLQSRMKKLGIEKKVAAG